MDASIVMENLENFTTVAVWMEPGIQNDHQTNLSILGDFVYLLWFELPFQALSMGTNYIHGSRIYITQIKWISRTLYV